MEFNAENVIERTRKLRYEFGSTKALAKASGCSRAMVNNYCSPAYHKLHKVAKVTWERYFGAWDYTVKDTEPATKASVVDDIVEEAKVEAPAVEQTETPAKPAAKSKIIIEVPSLEELEETLSQFGFRLEFVPR